MIIMQDALFNERRFRSGKIPDEMKLLYDKNITEMFVLTSDVPAYTKVREDHRTMTNSKLALAIVSSDGKKQVIGEMGDIKLIWVPVWYKMKSSLRRFGDLTVYRIKARLHESFYDRKDPVRLIYVLEVLESGASQPWLESVAEDYRKDVVIENDVLGKLNLDKQEASFSQVVKWRSTKIVVTIQADIFDPASQQHAVDIAADIVREQRDWDKKIRRFAAEQLTSLANDWREKRDIHYITEDEFASRITPGILVVDHMGEYMFKYGDDNMFLGHDIAVYGSMENGVQTARLEG